MKILEIILYYLFISIIIFIIFSILGIFVIFPCEIGNPKEFEGMYCLGNFVESVMLGFSIVLLFVITDGILFKSYKKFIK